MTSPLRRAQQRSSHLYVAGPESLPTPPSEGFLISDRARKAGAVIDHTTRRRPDGKGGRKSLAVPGYAGIKPVYGPFRDKVSAALDDDATSYRTPRSQRGRHARGLDRWVHPDLLSKQAVVGMIDLLWELNPGHKLTLIGHSKGGPDAVDGALRRIDKVGTVVLLGSGGLEEGQNLIRLGKRMPRIATVEGNSIRQMPREDALGMAGQALFHVLRNPWQTMGEGVEVGSRDLMVDEITTLRSHGIDVHGVQLEDDSFFPTDIALRDAHGLLDSHTVIEGLDHVGPQTHPDIVAIHIAGVLATARPSFESLASAIPA